MTKPAEDQLSSLTHHLKELLSRFADEKGVEAKFHKSKPLIRFTWKTPGQLFCEVTYDINQTSKAYIRDMVIGVIQNIEEKQKARHESPIVIATQIPKSMQGLH